MRTQTTDTGWFVKTQTTDTEPKLISPPVVCVFTNHIFYRQVVNEHLIHEYILHKLLVALLRNKLVVCEDTNHGYKTSGL